jgi:hypothetical protein
VGGKGGRETPSCKFFNIFSKDFVISQMDLLDILTFQCPNFKNKNKIKDYIMPNPIQTYDIPQNMRPNEFFPL